MSSIDDGRKRCNRLDGKTWTRYSISVWSDLRRSIPESRLNHPAAFPLQLAGRCIETVSYTHLDVYKRQAFYRGCAGIAGLYENGYL